MLIQLGSPTSSGDGSWKSPNVWGNWQNETDKNVSDHSLSCCNERCGDAGWDRKWSKGYLFLTNWIQKRSIMKNLAPVLSLRMKTLIIFSCIKWSSSFYDCPPFPTQFFFSFFWEFPLYGCWNFCIYLHDPRAFLANFPFLSAVLFILLARSFNSKAVFKSLIYLLF